MPTRTQCHERRTLWICFILFQTLFALIVDFVCWQLQVSVTLKLIDKKYIFFTVTLFI